MNSTVATAGQDRIATIGNGFPRLLGGFCLAERGFECYIHSSLPQHGQCRFHVRQAALLAPA